MSNSKNPRHDTLLENLLNNFKNSGKEEGKIYDVAIRPREECIRLCLHALVEEYGFTRGFAAGVDGNSVYIGGTVDQDGNSDLDAIGNLLPYEGLVKDVVHGEAGIKPTVAQVGKYHTVAIPIGDQRNNSGVILLQSEKEVPLEANPLLETCSQFLHYSIGDIKERRIASRFGHDINAPFIGLKRNIHRKLKGNQQLEKAKESINNFIAGIETLTESLYISFSDVKYSHAHVNDYFQASRTHYNTLRVKNAQEAIGNVGAVREILSSVKLSKEDFQQFSSHLNSIEELLYYLRSDQTSFHYPKYTTIERSLERQFGPHGGYNEESVRGMGITLTTDFEKVDKTFLDLPEVDRCIVNLMNNSIQALTSSKQEEKEMYVGLTQDEESIILHLSDNVEGGIPEDIVLGQPFQSKKQGGTGLGIYTVFEIVRDHGGSVAYDRARQEYEIRFPRFSVNEKMFAAVPLLKGSQERIFKSKAFKDFVFHGVKSPEGLDVFREGVNSAFRYINALMNRGDRKGYTTDAVPLLSTIKGFFEQETENGDDLNTVRGYIGQTIAENEDTPIGTGREEDKVRVGAFQNSVDFNLAHYSLWGDAINNNIAEVEEKKEEGLRRSLGRGRAEAKVFLNYGVAQIDRISYGSATGIDREQAFQKANNAFDEAMLRFTDDVEKARVHNSRGYGCIVEGRFNDADNELKESLKILAKISDGSEVIETLSSRNNQAEMHIRQKNYGEALKIADTHAASAGKNGYIDLYIELLICRGVSSLEEKSKGIEHLYHAEGLMKKWNYTPNMFLQETLRDYKTRFSQQSKKAG